MNTTDLPPIPAPRAVAPGGWPFVWGSIQTVHSFGRYAIAEYLFDASGFHPDDDARQKHGETRYHVYIDGQDTSRSARSLDEAIVTAIAIAHDGQNTHAHTYFMRMVRMDGAS